LLNDLRKERNITLLFIAHDLSVVRYFSDRIAVMYYGKIVELAPKKELFENPMHPYTLSLMSAIPKPDPILEKNKKKRIKYDPKQHDYLTDKPKLVEIEPGHFVLANKAEENNYRKKAK
jgi:oligopeptide transport system ATP-binding protein